VNLIFYRNKVRYNFHHSILADPQYHIRNTVELKEEFLRMIICMHLASLFRKFTKFTFLVNYCMCTWYVRHIQCTFNLAKKERCSRTVSLLNNTLCWGHNPRLSLTPSISLRMLCPLMMASPLVGGNNPTRMDIVVVLPAPLWPNNTVIWSWYMFKYNLSTAIFFPTAAYCNNTSTTDIQSVTNQI